MQSVKEIIEKIVAEKEEVGGIKEVYYVGCGGSYSAFYPAKIFMEKEARGIKSSLYSSNEFVYNTPKAFGKNTVVIVVSHKGNTPETIEAARISQEAGVTVIGLTWILDSELVQHCDYVLSYTFGDDKDIAGEKTGLTVIHGGNQYFKRTENGIENLIHREWESHFTAEVDWLHYTEFTYTLIPHAVPKSYPELFALTYGHICKPFVSVCEKGKYDRGFINAEGCAVSSVRKTDKGIEVRVFNPSDGKAAIKISPHFDFENVYITDLNGEIQSKQRLSGAFICEMTPWEILTVLFA